MRVLLVGAMGNMGKRYSVVLKYLGIDFYRRDKGVSDISDADVLAKVSHIIIATPTATHIPLIRQYMPYRKPILCEKPICKDPAELNRVMKECEGYGVHLSMVSQYSELVQNTRIGWTYYNFFKHGDDSLVWDCIQIIGLARSGLDLADDSPIWKCRINGQSLSLADMDMAYVKFVEQWLKDPKSDHGKLLAWHLKTQEMADSGTFRI